MGGGELALEMEAEVTEAVSDIKSLTGVPGMLTDAILACLDLSLSTDGIWGIGGAVTAEGGGASFFAVGTTRKVLGATVRLIGDPVAVAAGLAGTDFVEVTGVARTFLAWVSVLCELVAGDCSAAGPCVAAVISSFPGRCRFVDAGVVAGFVTGSLDSITGSFTIFFCGLTSAAVVFFLLFLTLVVSLLASSAMAFLSSPLCCCFFAADASSTLLAENPPAFGVFAVLGLVVDFVGVSGWGFAGVLGAGVTSAACFVFLGFEGVVVRTGVTGTGGKTGTAGVMVDDVVRDMGLEPGRDFDSSAIARGMAGAEKPGGIVGVARPGCVKNWPLIGVLGSTLR